MICDIIKKEKIKFSREALMIVVDSHCDSLYPTPNGEPCNIIKPYNFSNKYPHLQFAAMFSGRPNENEEESYERAKKYIRAFHATVEKERERLVWIRSFSDIERAIKEKKHSVLFTVEGGTGVMGKREILREFYEAGVRVFGFCWASNRLAKSNRLAEGEIDTGLSDIGREIADEGNNLGMIFDVSHMSDKSFYDIAEISKKPIIATHSNFRSLCPHSRNLTDDMARLIFKQGGMIGLNIYPPFISEDEKKQTVEGLFAHLDYGLSLGGENNIGFGCDIDGIHGMYPAPLSEERSMHDVMIEMMLKHNYTEELVKKIAGGNYIGFLKKYL